MGNVQSAAGENYKAKRPVLDFDNMPFLRPADVDPRLSQTHESAISSIDHSPDSVHTEWFGGNAHMPKYHDLQKSPSMSMQGVIAVAPQHSPSKNSISSQLSLLSQVCPAPNVRRSSSLKNQRNTFSCDASMPPEVPPHLLFKSSGNETQDELREQALAAIESLENEIEEEWTAGRRERDRAVHSNTLHRSRSRSRSRSSVHRPRSLSSPSLSDKFMLTTEVYTRKCPSPETPSLSRSSNGSEMTEEQRSESDNTSEFSMDDELVTPDNSPFALQGYSDGATKLRVVNWDTPAQPAPIMLPSAVTYETNEPHKVPSKYRVKSKAHLAEQEEELQRRRYARYGHTFRGTSAHRIS